MISSGSSGIPPVLITKNFRRWVFQFRSMCQTVTVTYKGLPKSNGDAHTAAAEIESDSTNFSDMFRRTQRARVLAGSCVPERATPGASGRTSDRYPQNLLSGT